MEHVVWIVLAGLGAAIALIVVVGYAFSAFANRVIDRLSVLRGVGRSGATATAGMSAGVASDSGSSDSGSSSGGDSCDSGGGGCSGE